MNKFFSDLNKQMQLELKKKETFADGIKSLLLLRSELFKIVETFFAELSAEDFSKMPFPKSKGNDNATIAWSIFHTFRIEDIVYKTQIKNENQIFFEKDFAKKLNSKIITTGNELSNEQMIEFSNSINIEELFCYAKEVKETSEKMILELSFENLTTKIPEEKKEYLRTLKVADDWLIEYWCDKNVRGLL